VLTKGDGWRRIGEVNPPELPDDRHLALDGVWSDVLVTDNVFGRIRVSPYAFGARIAHDVPSVHPTIVVSTRDRNILAIESEVRGALGNGVESFFVVVGDTVPHIDHLSHHHEIVEHLHDLQGTLPDFEVGMPTRFRSWHFHKRVGLGAQFFMAGPVLDPATVGPNFDLLELKDGDPPVFLMVIPAFSPRWVDRMETIGAVPTTPVFRQRIAEIDGADRRQLAWMITREVEQKAKEAGFAGVVLMGLKYDTVVGEAATWWRG
jgi:5,10-methylenetetrahydrofolate reductase